MLQRYCISMFWMLNLTYISRSIDFEIFLINIKKLFFFFFNFLIELCFEINLQIILFKTEQAKHDSEEYL